MRCCNCGGPAHPATGHRLGGKTWICGPCARKFFAWVVAHTNKRPSRKQRERGAASSMTFYEAAATSIKCALPPRKK